MRGLYRTDSSLAPEELSYAKDGEIDLKLREARGEVAALEHTVMELEKERDFYYGKLRFVLLMSFLRPWLACNGASEGV